MRRTGQKNPPTPRSGCALWAKHASLVYSSRTALLPPMKRDSFPSSEIGNQPFMSALQDLETTPTPPRQRKRRANQGWNEKLPEGHFPRITKQTRRIRAHRRDGDLHRKRPARLGRFRYETTALQNPLAPRHSHPSYIDKDTLFDAISASLFPIKNERLKIAAMFSWLR